MRRHLCAVVSRFRNHRDTRFIGPLVSAGTVRGASETGSKDPGAGSEALPVAAVFAGAANGLRRAVTGLLFWCSTTMKSSPSKVLRTGRTSSSRSSICSGLPCPTGRWRNHPNHRQARLRRTTGRAGGLGGRGLGALPKGKSTAGVPTGPLAWIAPGAVPEDGAVGAAVGERSGVPEAGAGLRAVAWVDFESTAADLAGVFDLKAGPLKRGSPS